MSLYYQDIISSMMCVKIECKINEQYRDSILEKLGGRFSMKRLDKLENSD